MARAAAAITGQANNIAGTTFSIRKSNRELAPFASFAGEAEYDAEDDKPVAPPVVGCGTVLDCEQEAGLWAAPMVTMFAACAPRPVCAARPRPSGCFVDASLSSQQLLYEPSIQVRRDTTAQLASCHSLPQYDWSGCITPQQGWEATIRLSYMFESAARACLHSFLSCSHIYVHMRM